MRWVTCWHSKESLLHIILPVCCECEWIRSILKLTVKQMKRLEMFSSILEFKGYHTIPPLVPVQTYFNSVYIILLNLQQLLCTNITVFVPSGHLIQRCFPTKLFSPISVFPYWWQIQNLYKLPCFIVILRMMSTPDKVPFYEFSSTLNYRLYMPS
jgi:hypothetical protein